MTLPQTHTNAADFYRSLMAVSGWDGQGAQAARSAMTGTAGDHDAVAENLGAAANRIDLIHQDAEDVVAETKSILNDAAVQPAVAIDETTNQVIPPDTSHMTEEYAAQVAAKVTDLRGRIAAVLADGERLDANLAGAITAASGRTEPVAKTATSLQELLLPKSDDQPPGDKQPLPSPDNLDGALDQLTQGAGAGRGPVPLHPVKVEQFKALARETMLRDGVPPEVVEQRLDAAVAAAQKPLPATKPAEREPMPKPGFSDGFADGWFNTEEGIKDLVGANGWEELKGAWTDMATGTWERVTNPIDSMKEEAEHLINYPGHFLGEAAGSTALTAPGAMVGGEVALGARAVGGIPDSVIDTPGPTSAVDHASPTQLTDIPSHHGAHTPIVDALPPPPLPPDSPLFDGYEPIPPGPEFTNPDGSLIYPDDSLPSKPYAVPGTVIPDVQLAAGTELGRFGYPGGTYLAPEGTPFAELSLPSDSAGKPYYRYVVDDPTALPPGWSIEQSLAAPWFHQPGGGTQFRVIAPEGVQASTETLVEWGFLKEVR